MAAGKTKYNKMKCGRKLSNGRQCNCFPFEHTIYGPQSHGFVMPSND